MFRVAIIGDGRISEALKNEYLSNPILGRKIIYDFPDFSDLTKCILRNLKSQSNLHEVIYTGTPGREVYQSMLSFCEENRINFKYSADFFFIVRQIG